VNENIIISPLNQMTSLGFPPTEIEGDVERLNIDTIKPFRTAYTPTLRIEDLQSMFGPSTQSAYEPGNSTYGDYRRDLKFDMDLDNKLLYSGQSIPY
jgi:hypothetical protein